MTLKQHVKILQVCNYFVFATNIPNEISISSCVSPPLILNFLRYQGHVYVFCKSHSVVFLVTPWIIARQAPLSIAFSRQEYWCG